MWNNLQIITDEEFDDDDDDDGIIEITPDINEDFDEFTEDDIIPCTYEDETANAAAFREHGAASTADGGNASRKVGFESNGTS